MRTFAVINDKGRRFNLKLIELGDKYGRDDCLIHDKSEPFNHPLVEFYDAKNDQFIGRYFSNTLLERDHDYGLDLHGGVPEWGIDRYTMKQVFRWLQMETTA